MSLPSHLQADLGRIFTTFATSPPTPKGAGKAFEVWLAMTMAEKVHRLPNWKVFLRDGMDNPLTLGSPFVLKSQMGGVRPLGASGPTIILLACQVDQQVEMELHTSLQWTGRSGVSHEIDISILPRTMAADLRGTGGGCPVGLPVAAIECKDKIQLGGLDEAREKLARLFDTTHLGNAWPANGFQIHTASGVGWGQRGTSYKDTFRDGMFGIARATRFQSGAVNLLNYYQIAQYDGLYDPSGGRIGVLLQRLEQRMTEVQ